MLGSPPSLGFLGTSQTLNEANDDVKANTVVIELSSSALSTCTLSISPRRVTRQNMSANVKMRYKSGSYCKPFLVLRY